MKTCSICGQEHRASQMRNSRGIECINARRRREYAHDPDTRQRRIQQRDVGADPDLRRERQRAYHERLRHELRVPIHLPQNPNISDKELQPVILPDWFWYLMGRKVLKGRYNPQQVNPSSYDTLLADKLLLQRYRGVEYPNTPATLTAVADTVLMSFRSPVTGEHQQVYLHQHPFTPGDCVLAKTVEKFYVPRFVRLQGMLKSSVAREGVDSRSALYVDPKFSGNITLELHFDRSGYLVPHMPLIQFEAQLCLSLKPYKGHYVGQEEVTPNRNKTGIGFRSVVQ